MRDRDNLGFGHNQTEGEEEDTYIEVTKRQRKGEGGEIVQTMYMHVSKYKNNKVKKKQRKVLFP